MIHRLFKDTTAMYDVIIVLAGGIKDNGELPENVKKRVDKAVSLYSLHHADRILMTGRWSSFRQTRLPPMTEAEAMARYAIALNIPVENILLETKSHNTVENAFFCKKFFLVPKKWRKIIIVTSDFHLPRTKQIFNDILGENYTIEYHATVTTANFFTRCKWFIYENLVYKLLRLLLGSRVFLKYQLKLLKV